MKHGLDPRDTVYVARQPILYPSGRVYGYELLYRSAASDASGIESGDIAGARVLTDTVLTMGLETLTNGLPAFFNLTPRLLLSGAATLLSPAAAVFELPADMTIDHDLVDACRQLHAQGYSLALDDFTPTSPAETLLPFVRFVKVDVSTVSNEAGAGLCARLLPRGVRLIANHVETAQAADVARDAGFGLAQGFFFCRPATVAGPAVPAQRLAYLNLLAALNDPRLNIGALEDLVKHDLSLSHRVLRCVNSAGFGMRGEIHSIRQAVMMLGLDQIRKWASVWSLAGLRGGGTPEILTTAILRARCCELLGQALSGADTGSEFFLLGLCSLLDVVLRRPMASVIADLPLPPAIRDALVGRPNVARSVLDAVVAYERGAWDRAVEAAERAGIRATLLPDTYADALGWAHTLAEQAEAA
jgi:c-di-GMP-related signal transduction protein